MTTKNTKIIPKPYIPMNELPEWAYTKTEWNQVEEQTMDIVDGVRMVYDYEEWNRLKYRDQNNSMDRLGLI